ncbi:MAG: endoglucanase, partial [Oscillospiraceae bacterium]
MKFKKLSAVILSMAMLATSLSGVGSAVTVDDCHDDWLHAEGDKLYDMYGNEVWLTGANWFG